ncbi:MAG TPA: glycosyltransferase family 2 protein [Chloroflexota bacterium]|nr:glycosyltransferase family 2 protein [Chloroflexota bacterium]
MTSEAPEIAAVVLTHNEAARIDACLAMLRWADRMVVLDSASEDGTAEAARAAGAEVINRAFGDFAEQRNHALAVVETDWILFVDADEQISPELAAEIRQRAGREEYVAYAIPRRNRILGGWLRATGWYPDHQTRLLRRDSCRYTNDRPVHEVVEVDGPVGTLQSEMRHAGADSIAEFREQQRRYAALAAEGLRRRGIRAGIRSPFGQALREFWRRMVELRGYRDGWRGLVLSVLMVEHEFRVYSQLRSGRRR